MSEVNETLEAIQPELEVVETTPEGGAPVEQPKPEPTITEEAFQKRLAREKRKLQREAEEEVQKRVNDHLSRQPQNTQPIPAPPSGAPKIDDFPTYEDYRQAATRWEVKEELRQEREKENQSKAQREAQTLQETWKQRESKAMDKIDDYEEVADLNRLRREGALNPAMAQAIIGSEFGPELLYALGKDTDRAKQIANMNPADAIRALGRMEARFETPATTTKQPSNAPAPITPITGAKGPGTVDPAKLSDADYVKQRKAEYQARMAQRAPAAQRGRR
jgi:hypothetical protein